MTGTFLYGIVERANPAKLDIRGIDGTSRVRVAASGDFGAVVSAHQSATDFHAQPREGVFRCLLAYQRVIERLVQRQMVLPVKFGTVLASAGEARDLISQNRTALRNAFDSVRGTVEIELAATWDISRILHEVGGEPAVVTARETIERSGHASPDDRVQLGRLVKSCLDQRRTAIRDRALDVLGSLATRVASHALLDDRFVMNEAFQITRERLPEFDRRVRQLDALFEDQILFRVVGPLPPYTFCTVEVTRVTARQLDEARDVLGLDAEGLDDHAVRGAYRNLAAQTQRQLRVASSAGPRVGQLKEASELLLARCRADPAARQLTADRRDRWVARIQSTGLVDISPASFGGGV